ncbi:hypothetical protein ASC91_18845 [Pelomonas sp. Root1237]|nr:hypothetical protein ASC91_18845 [Pelomonas sp. Root1237]
MLASIVMRSPVRILKARISGLTLIEIMVAVAVLGVILAMAIPSMADLLERRRVTAAAEEVSGILTYAKAETNAANSLLFVRFDPHATMSCAMVVTSAGGNNCRCHYPANNLCPTGGGRSLRLFQLPKTHVQFDAEGVWAAGNNYIRFARDQMTMETGNFQVDVVGLGKGYTLRIEVNGIGRVRVCAPSAPAERNEAKPFQRMSGYASC